MQDPHSQSLIYPVSAGLVAPLRRGAPIVGFGRMEAEAIAAHGGASCLVQGFRPLYLALSDAGMNVVPQLESDGARFERALVRLGRHRGQNDRWLRLAVETLFPGGLVIAAGARTDGTSSARKRLSAIVPTLGHAAMNHGEVFWFTVDDPAALASVLAEPQPALIEGRFHTAPGMFSHAHVDPGSRLLADALPQNLGSDVADFGAGWGYLSARIAERPKPPATLDLYEADYESLAAARRNVGARSTAAISFHWHDLLREPVLRAYDSVVMNPPFHTGRKAEPDLGSAMIHAAAAALKPQGTLFLVANRQLPYEAALRGAFGSLRELDLSKGYKVIAAANPLRLRSRAASVR